MHTGLCICTVMCLSKLAKRFTITFASFTFSPRWSFKNAIQRCCCDLGKNIMYLLLWSDWDVARCPAYVCCSEITPLFMCLAIRIFWLYNFSSNG